MGKDEADHERFPTDKDVDEVIEEFGGDARQTVRALLHDLAILAADYDASVSRGYVRAWCRGPRCGGRTEHLHLPCRPSVRTDEDGQLCPDQPIECPSPAAAVSRARAAAANRAGAVAFSRTGHPDLGEYADAVLLARIGDVPTDLESVSG